MISVDEKMLESAFNIKIDQKQMETTTKNYMKALYPTGNIKIVYSWNNQAYVSTADRDEVHYKLGENKYGFRIKEVPVIFVNRVLGESKMSGGIFSEALFGVISLKWNSFFKKYKQS